jgi:hypothetical protein
MATAAPELNADQARIVDALLANLHVININSEHLSIEAKRDLTRHCIEIAGTQAGADVVDYWVRNYTHPTLRQRVVAAIGSERMDVK